jgi:ketosteroid isomerase-like protein
MSDLEARVKRLEDIDEIKKVKNKYCYCVDAHDIDGILSTFAEDIKADYGPLGTYDGIKEVRRFFTEVVTQVLPFYVHMVHNGSVEVNGDQAEGRWYFEVPANHAPSNKAVWLQGRYDDKYKKVNGEWKCSVMNCTFIYMTPYDKGWMIDKGL